MEQQDFGLEAVFLDNRDRLLRFFISRTRDRDEAEDVLQEIFLRLGRVATGPIVDPLAYLHRMGINIVVDRNRGRQRRALREEEWSEMTTQRIGAEAVDDSPSAFVTMVAQEREARIANALASLPPGAARAFRLHKIDGLSHGQVAEQLGISRKGVEKHMAVAFRHLTRELKE